MIESMDVDLKVEFLNGLAGAEEYDHRDKGPRKRKKASKYG